MENIWSSYIVFRIIIGFVDGVTDLLLCAHLISSGQPYWGLGILGCTILAISISLLYVIVGRCRHGDPMDIMKYILMTIKVHAEVVSAFFQGAPSLIIQLIIVWSGVYQHDLQVLSQAASWAWFWAWVQLISIITSFTSVLFTTVRYNNDQGPGRRVFWSIMASIITCTYRAFIISIMFKLAPLISCIIFAILYILTTCIMRWWGDDSVSFLHAYCSLLLPVGQTHGTSASPGYSLATGIPESERARINQVGLFRRIEKFCCLHFINNILLLIPYITFIELWLHPTPELYSINHILSSRVFTYLTPALLLLVSTAVLVLYYTEARKAVNASTFWSQISTSPAQQPSLQNPSAQLTVQPDAAVPVPPSPSRPMAPQTSNPTIPPASSLPDTSLYPQIPSAPFAPSAPSEAGDAPRPGNQKCENVSCVTCAWLVEGPAFHSTVTKKQYLLMTTVSCTTDRVIYLVTCRGCRKQYVGKTEQTLRQRHYGHRREIETLSSPLGQHFGRDCGYQYWSIQIIDTCDAEELPRREGYWQHELSTLAPGGLNIRDELGGRQKM